MVRLKYFISRRHLATKFEFQSQNGTIKIVLEKHLSLPGLFQSQNGTIKIFRSLKGYEVHLSFQSQNGTIKISYPKL